MKALWLQDKQISLQTRPTPEPSETESLIRISLAGICATDQELAKGYYGFQGIPGHEFVGVVEKGPENLVGQRVVADINIPCQRCSYCQQDLQHHCPNRKVVGIKNHPGAFAEYITLPNENLFLVPPTLSDEQAVFAEPLAAALEIQEQVNLSNSPNILLIGAGKLGQLIARTLAGLGQNLLVTARSERSLKPLESKGIQTCLVSQLPPQQFDLVIECSGNSQGFETAVNSVKPRGTLILKSTYRDNVSVNLSQLVVNEVSVIGSRCGPMEKALSLLNNNQLNPTDLITDIFPLDQGVSAFKKSYLPDSFKVLIKP